MMLLAGLHNIMGACCKLFSKGEQPSPPKEENQRTQLISRQKMLSVSRHTSNDSNFTYFLDVFDLSHAGAILKLPEYADENNTNFSYQKFHEAHRQYYRLVKELGIYIKRRKNPDDQLNRKIQYDCKKIKEGRQVLGFQKSKLPGCMVKLEVQGVAGSGVDQISITHRHPQHWSGKFQQTLKTSQLKANPLYFEFIVPEIFTSSIKIVGKPRQVHLEVPLNESFEAGKITFCQVLHWQGGKEGEGVAVRMQLFEGGEEGERMQAMEGLYATLMKEFEGDAILDSKLLNNEQIAQRFSRHRSSLYQQYNLNNNSMF